VSARAQSSSYSYGSNASSASAGSSGTPGKYSQPGRFRPLDLNPITIRVGGDDELPITAQLQPTVPQGVPPGHKAPLIILSAGFLLSASMYRSYASDLAAWGYAVLLYDMSEVTDDVQAVTALKKVIDTAMTDPQLRPLLDPTCVVLAGHSRGGKLSALLAGKDTRVKGLMLLDPVDSTPMTPPGEGFPTSLPGLRQATSPPRSLPVLVLGAGEGGDVVPESGNYRRFMEACSGPLWSVEISGAGHLGFLDKQIGLFSMFSTPGSTPDDAVRAASKAAMLAWMEEVVCPLCSRGPASGTPGSTNPKSALESEASVISKRLAPLGYSVLRNIPSPPAGYAAGGASSYASGSYDGGGSSSSGSGRGSSSGSSARTSSASPSSSSSSSLPPITESYEQLMTKRAKELKAMLVERGVPCADVFEKEQLARRLVERCGVKQR